jgi:sulfur carrier protein
MLMYLLKSAPRFNGNVLEKSMQIKINGKPEEIQAKTVLELLQAKDIEPQMVSVELNSTIVDRAAYSTLTLKEGDTLEFLFFMGGGEGFDPANKVSERGRLRLAPPAEGATLAPINR